MTRREPGREERCSRLCCQSHALNSAAPPMGRSQYYIDLFCLSTEFCFDRASDVLVGSRTARLQKSSRCVDRESSASQARAFDPIILFCYCLQVALAIQSSTTIIK